MDNTFTDDQRVEMIENQCDHIIALCETYVEGDTLGDVGSIRALYEEYGEWLDTYNAVEGAPEEYITAWAPNLMDCAS